MQQMRGFVRSALAAGLAGASIIVAAPGVAAQGTADPAVPPARELRAGAMGVREAALIAEGWALLAQGRYPQAVAHAARILAITPRSVPALTLLVEAEAGRAGAHAALTQYDNWLGQRTHEEPGVLRRIAVVLLKEEAAQRQDSRARAEALRALANEGDQAAISELAAAVTSGQVVEIRTLAALGDETAVNALLASLDKPGGDHVLTLDALGESRSTRAIAPLVARLDDPRMEVRGAAAQALGKIGSSDVIGRLRPLLSDKSGYVRVKAAGALYRLNDHAGLQVLQETLTDPDPSMRLAAAEAMAGVPDVLWTSTVRELTTSANPEIRVAAAGLLAREDPQAATQVLQEAAASDNPAIREMAARATAETVTDDIPTLRRVMRNPERFTRVRAAARLLALTR